MWRQPCTCHVTKSLTFKATFRFERGSFSWFWTLLMGRATCWRCPECCSGAKAWHAAKLAKATRESLIVSSKCSRKNYLHEMGRISGRSRGFSVRTGQWIPLCRCVLLCRPVPAIPRAEHGWVPSDFQQIKRQCFSFIVDGPKDTYTFHRRGGTGQHTLSGRVLEGESPKNNLKIL